MLISRRVVLVLFAACLTSSLFGQTAGAAEPASVTVRVEGAAGTLLPPTRVTTTTAPVVKEGHSCSGTSAAGALQLASSGNWAGSWFELKGSGDFFVNSIEGESYAGSPSHYWSFWIDNKPSTKGICGVELVSGDSVLFFPECFSGCPPPPNPLGIEAPAVAEVGKPLSVTVASYANASGARSAAQGAEVAYEGAKAITDSSGHATLTFANSGEMTVKATAPQSIRTEASICVHTENDGKCGTSITPATPSPPVGPISRPAPAPYRGASALVAAVKGITDGHVYRHGSAPRVLAGTVLSHNPVAAVSLELRRSYKGRCWAYNGASERFRRARCGTGELFPVSSSDSFSYLLPATLAQGRYVLDVSATDAAGNHTSLARGTSRIVFYVR